MLVAVARNRQECVLNAIESQSLLACLLERERKRPTSRVEVTIFFPSFRALKSFPFKKKMLRVDQLVSDKTRMLLLDRHPSLISQRAPIHLKPKRNNFNISSTTTLDITIRDECASVCHFYIYLYVFTLCLASALVLLFAMSNAKKKKFKWNVRYESTEERERKSFASPQKCYECDRLMCVRLYCVFIYAVLCCLKHSISSSICTCLTDRPERCGSLLLL